MLPISGDNIPQNVKPLDPDDDQYFLLTPKSVLRATPMLFEPEQIQPSKSLNTFSAQEARRNSNPESTNFWIGVLFTKCSNATMQLLGKAISYVFLAISEKYPNDFHSTRTGNRIIPHNVLRVGLHDHL